MSRKHAARRAAFRRERERMLAEVRRWFGGVPISRGALLPLVTYLQRDERRTVHRILWGAGPRKAKPRGLLRTCGGFTNWARFDYSDTQARRVG
jgi:hypothetical protein